MGSWSTALYSDDTASDVKALLKDLKQFGISGKEAYRIALEQFDPEETTFWLSLADCLWKEGRLPKEVKDKALGIIASRSDLELWQENPSDQKKREKVLQKLESQLRSELPVPKKLRERFEDISPWNINELVEYSHSTGHSVIMRVVGHFTRFGGQSPIFEVLDWSGTVAPSPTEAAGLALLDNEQYEKFGDRAPGQGDPEAQLKIWKDKSWLSDDVTWKDWQLAWRYSYLVPIRHKKQPKEWRRMKSLDIESPSPRRFFSHVVPLNGWRLWKDFEINLAGKFVRYRWDGWPSLP